MRTKKRQGKFSSILELMAQAAPMAINHLREEQEREALAKREAEERLYKRLFQEIKFDQKNLHHQNSLKFNERKHQEKLEFEREKLLKSQQASSSPETLQKEAEKFKTQLISRGEKELKGLKAQSEGSSGFLGNFGIEPRFKKEAAEKIRIMGARLAQLAQTDAMELFQAYKQKQQLKNQQIADQRDVEDLPINDLEEEFSTQPTVTSKKNLEALLDPIVYDQQDISVKETSEEREKRQLAKALRFFQDSDKAVKDFAYSAPSGILDLIKGGVGLGELSKKTAGVAKSAKKAIGKAQRSYEELTGIDSDSKASKAGRIAGELAVPVGRLTQILGPGRHLAKAVASGSIFGSLEEGKKNFKNEKEAREAIAKGVLKGASLGGLLHGVGKGFSNVFGRGKVRKNLAQIRSDAKISDPDGILRTAELMGPEATIAEIVGSKSGIEKTMQGNVAGNKDRLGRIEKRMGQRAKQITDAITDERIPLYQNIEKRRAELREGANLIYDQVKESGLGERGLLNRKQIAEWLKLTEEASPYVKGLPTLKTTKVSNKDYFRKMRGLLMSSPKGGKDYKNFVIQHLDEMPTADNFLVFRSKVGQLLKKANPSEVQALEVLKSGLDRILEKSPNNNLGKASKKYATDVVPFWETAIEEAIKTGKHIEQHPIAPRPADVFKKSKSGLVFNHLDSGDKVKVVDSFVKNEFMEKEDIAPFRAIANAFNNMPDYIKKSKDPAVIERLKQFQTFALKNEALSAIQQATSSTIGSRPVIKKNSLSPTSMVNRILEQGSKLKNKHYRSTISQRNLGEFLDPSLLDNFADQTAKDIYSNKFLNPD